MAVRIFTFCSTIMPCIFSPREICHDTDYLLLSFIGCPDLQTDDGIESSELLNDNDELRPGYGSAISLGRLEILEAGCHGFRPWLEW